MYGPNNPDESKDYVHGGFAEIFFDGITMGEFLESEFVLYSI